MAENQTEVEFAGVKFRGGRIFAIILALSTLGGGLYERLNSTKIT